MSKPPTFGRYAEIPYEQMTPEQQEGYRSYAIRGHLRATALTTASRANTT